MNKRINAWAVKLSCLVCFLVVTLACSAQVLAPINYLLLDDETSGSVVAKPTGTFSSFISNGLPLANVHAKGVLVRVKWSQLESSKGVYDWDLIYDQLALMDANSTNKLWSLGIVAGQESPAWLYQQGVDSYEVPFQQNTVTLPKFWDIDLQDHLADLAIAVANEFKSDPRLVLVYVPQMSSNGIEGHFNGAPEQILTDAGFTKALWIASVKQAANTFADAFDNKALAVEVHEILRDASVPETIINDLWSDPEISQRVGAAMWWISGNDTYQPDLITVLTEFPGDVYGQVIGRSDQTDRFPEGGYSEVFEQAKAIGMRYIEPWDYEFINNTYPELFEDFNTWSDSTFD